MSEDLIEKMCEAYTERRVSSRNRASMGECIAAALAILSKPENISDEMISAAMTDQAKDDEGTFPMLMDLIDFSGENKTRTVIRSAIAAAIGSLLK